MLKYEIPVVFDIIMDMTPTGPFKEPSLFLIETICKASKDPSFQKKKYSRYLEEYARTGLCCRRPKKLTPERKVYYEKIREKKMNFFIEKNKIQIECIKYFIH